MGEYANYEGREIKIGTCDNMYYLRYEDRYKVEKLPSSVNPATEQGLRFRLPYPDEDTLGPGGYNNYNRTAELYKEGKYYSDREFLSDPGWLQLRHDNGLLIGVSCYHGMRLPEMPEGMSAHWNAKNPHLGLAFLKPIEGKIWAVIQCKYCEQSWRVPMREVIEWVSDEKLRDRLQKYV